MNNKPTPEGKTPASQPSPACNEMRNVLREAAEFLYGSYDSERERERIAKRAWLVLDACDKCAGSGEVDSGGVYPWGEGISVPCDCGPSPARSDTEHEKCAECGGWSNSTAELHNVGCSVLAGEAQAERDCPRCPISTPYGPAICFNCAEKAERTPSGELTDERILEIDSEARKWGGSYCEQAISFARAIEREVLSRRATSERSEGKPAGNAAQGWYLTGFGGSSSVGHCHEALRVTCASCGQERQTAGNAAPSDLPLRDAISKAIYDTLYMGCDSRDTDKLADAVMEVIASNAGAAPVPNKK